MNNMSTSVRNEIEKLQEIIFPLMKKTSRYVIWSFPLLGIALVNLVWLVLFAPSSTGTMIMSGVYALMGAIGMALFKESKINKKKMRKIGNEYMIERIEKSVYVSEGRKKEYIKFIQKQPIKATSSFIQFLNEEETLMER